jgi:predicted Fe-S protein YdhL (DUF1289 family)
METPCVKVCTYDAAAGLCRGCGRNLEEIAAWAGMTAEQRQKILAELPARLRRLSLPAG